jgi:RimJ/RimL family protein N-acetyltransferase
MACRSRWRTERISLRRFVNADAEPLREAIFAEADVMKTLIGDASSPKAQSALAAEWIERWNACWEDNGYGVWAVEIADPALGEPGKLIGFSGFEAPALPDEGPELIAGRASAYWSQGISTELGHAVVGHLFAHTSFPSVHALVFYEINPAAIRMMEKLGFSAAGEVPIHARVGPGYQRQTLSFELQRVLIARPGRERLVLDVAAFKVGQLLGCRAVDLPSLRGAITGALEEAAWRDGWRAPLPAEDYRSLGTAWLDMEVERRLRKLGAARADSDTVTARRAVLALASTAAAVARDLADAARTLEDHAARRGLTGPELAARIRERVAAGAAHPTMRLFRRERSVDDVYA